MTDFAIPQGVIPKHVSFDFGDDESQLFNVYYIGSEASAQLTVDSAGDMEFLHGASGAEAADTDTKLDAGGLGIIDISADVGNYHSLERWVNGTDNWRLRLTGALPDDEPHTTGTGHFSELTTEAVPSAGLAVTTDDTDSKYVVAGLIWEPHPNYAYNLDNQVVHVLRRVISVSAYTSGTSVLKAYSCDDVAGTSTEIKSWTVGATTVEVAYPVETYNIDGHVEAMTQGKRLVVKLLNSAAMGTVVRLKIEGMMFQVGPVGGKGRDWVDRLDA